MNYKAARQQLLDDVVPREDKGDTSKWYFFVAGRAQFIYLCLSNIQTNLFIFNISLPLPLLLLLLLPILLLHLLREVKGCDEANVREEIREVAEPR